jgi:FkbM family methyltransferase
MKTLLRSILRRLDLDIVRTHTTLEGHIARLLRALRVDVVLDVGAHRGEYARLLRHLGYRGRIVSFEPVAATYAALEAAMRRDPNWRGLNVALGADRGVRNINVTAASEQTSFLTPSANGVRWFGAASTVTRTETVTVECLDDLIGSCLDGIREPRVYLKLDTQGFDWQVIQGGRATVHQFVVGMQTEIAAQPLYEGVSLFPDNVGPFIQLGFEATGLFAVSRDPRDMIAAIEYDLIMRRRA